MRWIAQVGHVARKDVRQVGWMLLLYAATVAVSTGGIVTGKTFGPYSSTPNSIELGMPDSFTVIVPALLSLIAILSVATLVQLDSPTRPNAFWSTRPLSPSAVLTSKLIVAGGGILGLAIVGVTIALRSIHTDASTISGIILSATLSSFDWILAVLVLGALTRDIRGFIVGLTTTILGLLLLTWILDGQSIMLDTWISNILTIAPNAVGLWFVIRLYRTHERGRATWIAGFVIAFTLIFVSFFGPPVSSDVPMLNQRATLQVAPVMPNHSKPGTHLPVRLRIAQVADSERLDFTPDSVVWKGAAGKESPVNRGTFATSVVAGALPWIGHTVRWLNVDTTTLAWPSSLTVEPRQADPQSIGGKINSVSIGGVVTVSTSHVIANLPLKYNASFVKNGRRLVIYGNEGVAHDSAEARVLIQLTSVRRRGRIPQPESHLNDLDNLQFALVNDERREAVVIDAPTEGSISSGPVVLPQISMLTTFKAFSTGASFFSRPVSLDDGWYKGARLVVVEWTVIGRYRTVGEAAVE